VVFGQEATARLYAKNKNIWNVINTSAPLVDDGSAAVSIRALRHFKNVFDDTTGSRWYLVKDGFIAKIVRGDVAIRMGYDKRGDWDHSIKYYAEDKLPFEIRDAVKRNYYDSSIDGVEEIDIRQHGLYYLVHIHDNTHWTNVLVHDGEMEIMKRWEK